MDFIEEDEATGEIAEIYDAVKKALDSESAEGGLLAVIQHASITATTMMDLRFMEDIQWSKNLSMIPER